MHADFAPVLNYFIRQMLFLGFSDDFFQVAATPNEI